MGNSQDYEKNRKELKRLCKKKVEALTDAEMETIIALNTLLEDYEDKYINN